MQFQFLTPELLDAINAVNTFSKAIQEKIPDMQPALDAISKITASIQIPSINLPSDTIQNIRQLSSSLSEINITQNQIFSLLDFPATQPEITKEQLKRRVESMDEKEQSKMKDLLVKAQYNFKKSAPTIIKEISIGSLSAILGELFAYLFLS